MDAIKCGGSDDGEGNVNGWMLLMLLVVVGVGIGGR